MDNFMPESSKVRKSKRRRTTEQETLAYHADLEVLDESQTSSPAGNHNYDSPPIAERQLSERAMRKRHINRENARKSRQRKKEREIFLQSENEKLAMENERLLQALLIFIRSASGEQLEQWGLPIDSDVPITTDTIRYWVSNCNIAAISKVATNQPNLGLNTIHNPVHSTAISSEAMAFERSEDTTSTDHQSLRSSSSGGSSSFSSETQPFQSVSYTQLPQSKTSSTPEVTVSDEHYQVRLTDGSLPQRMLSLESHLPSWGGEQQHISDVHFTAQASFPSLFSEESLPAPATSSWRSELPSASASIHEEGQGGGT